MKKLLLMILSGLSLQSVLAMEPEQPTLSQEERDSLAWDLDRAVRNQEYEKAIALIDRGANVNKVVIHQAPILNLVDDTWHLEPLTSEQEEQRIRLVQKFIEKGAQLDVSLLIECRKEKDGRIFQLLLDGGADIYGPCEDGMTPLIYYATTIPRIEFVEMLVQKAISMNSGEINCVKGWLLACTKNEIRAKFKDLRKPVAEAMINALVQDVLDRLIRAGAQEAYNLLDKDANTHGEILEYLANALNPENVRTYVRNQVFDVIRKSPFTRELSEDEAFGTFNSSTELGTGNNNQ